MFSRERLESGLLAHCGTIVEEKENCDGERLTLTSHLDKNVSSTRVHISEFTQVIDSRVDDDPKITLFVVLSKETDR